LGAFLRCVGAIGTLEGGLEVGEVGGEGLGIELHAEAVGDKEGAMRSSWWFEGIPEEGEGHAELVASGFGSGFGPEEFDEALTGV
jgi:hypothetical protein